MDRVQRSVLREGVVAGLIGATVVAVWFLVFDTLRGQPFHTPALLGTAVFQGVEGLARVRAAPGVVVGYTVIHGLAFIAFGVIAASVIAASEREPPLVIAVVILFACFETFFLGVQGVLGRWLPDALVWWEILAANFLAAVAMLWYFLARHRALPGLLVGRWAVLLREGVAAGLIGAAVVAVWFLVIDAIQGDLLRTPRLLAAAFLGVEGPLAAVSAYTVVHGIAFVALGIVAAALIAGAEHEPMFVFVLVILFTAFEVFFFGALVIGASWVLDVLAAWTIFVGNLLAAAAMLAYFFQGHRGLAKRLAAAWAEED